MDHSGPLVEGEYSGGLAIVLYFESLFEGLQVDDCLDEILLIDALYDEVEVVE